MGLSMIFSLLCGVSLFLFGMMLMGDGLKKVAGNTLEVTLYRLSKSPVKGIMFGAFVTAVIQSASATSAMVIGFVNSGIMKVAHSLGVIIGANIGTSMNGWILCLSYMDGSKGLAALLSTTTITAVVAVVGIIFKMFAKRILFRRIGDVMFGFVILMVGMQMMSGAVAPLRESEEFGRYITMFEDPLLGILLGIVLSVLLQSSCASIGVMQALSITGEITFALAFPMVMGIGIGASCPVLLSGIGSGKNGKRTAFSFLVINVLGVILAAILFYGTNAIFHFSCVQNPMTPVSIAFLNSAFRIGIAILLLPLLKQVEKILYFFIPNKEDDDLDTEDFDLLEDTFLETPALAISQSQMVMDGMVRRVEGNLLVAIGLLNEYSELVYRKVRKKEKLINKYEDKLESYLVRIADEDMNPEQSRQVSKILYMVGEFERLADQAVSIADVANELFERKASFSEEACKEVEKLNSAVKEMLNLTVDIYRFEDMQRVTEVTVCREKIIELCGKSKLAHIARLQEGRCNKQSEFVFHKLLDKMEHIAVYCSNVTVTLNELNQKKENES